MKNHQQMEPTRGKAACGPWTKRRFRKWTRKLKNGQGKIHKQSRRPWSIQVRINDNVDKAGINDANDVTETLEALERGGMVKDYNSNSTNLDSEDEEDPRTPASVSSQVMIDCKNI